MNFCINCYEQLERELTWSNWLTVEKSSVVCQSCASQFVKIAGQRCQVCSRAWESSICRDCQQWRELGDPIEKNYSVFQYNEFIREIISQWKFRGDYVLRELFRNDLKNAFEKEFSGIASDLMVVPIPLSKNRMEERGFNQSLALAEMLGVSIQEVLSRITGEKQAKKNRKARLKRDNPFYVVQPLKQAALLIDDIYTTGTTLRHAAQQLKNHGCPAVYSLTLARS